MLDSPLPDAPLDASPSSQPKSSPALVCVCCNCDRVRTRSGKWIGDYTPVAGERRTHGICPDCFQVLYPDFSLPKGK